MEELQCRNEREYSRVDTYLSLQVGRVPPGETENLRSRSTHEFLGVSFPPLPDLGDQVLAESMQIINAKLDAILKALSLQGEGMQAPQVSPVNISGSGLRFYSSERFVVGDILEIKFLLPAQPDVLYYVYGHVVRREASACDRHNVCVNFTVIDEDIRSKIVKFVFEKQREQLRKKRRQ
jgi:hypothetical protein